MKEQGSNDVRNCEYMDQIFLYKSAGKTISYDDTQWYISEKAQPITGEVNTQRMRQLAADEAYKVAAEEISLYAAHFKNVAVLSAAGTSMENGAHQGRTRKELLEFSVNEIDAIKAKLCSEDGLLKDKCQKAIADENIEEFLSLVILYEKLHGELKDGEGNSLRDKLESKIAEACTLELDEKNSHHQDFIRKLTSRKPSDPRVQLFTTNYDTLFEQAAQRMNYTIIDGFSFFQPRVFNGSNFDRDIVFREKTRIKQEESFVPSVIQLFKLHGSIDWEKQDNGKILQVSKTNKPCIIYPATEKYESSYEQPYFEMMSHFQSTLRKEGTLLIVVGFGFQDKHIQNAIKEAVIQNPNFHLLIVCYGTYTGKDADGNDAKIEGIADDLIPGFTNVDGTAYQNVSVLFSKFKAFVEHYPINSSYGDDLQNETIRS